MHLKSYLNLYALLQNNVSTREERRAFGLDNVTLKNEPIKQLLAWENKYIHHLKKPLLSGDVSSYLYIVTFSLVIIAFILGLLSGITLLSYNGHEPVNIVYFIAMVVFLPLFTMLLSLFSMFRAKNSQSVLLHLTPAYWMEKILKFFPGIDDENIKNFKINPLLANWIVIRRSQFIALFFSLGLLLALLGVVVTKDIAFAWSTTLHITPEVFHGFLNTLALPWREFFPAAVPSIELIERSQYFRLGDKLSEEMISNASQLGQWWKFLAFATLLYALFLRCVMYVIATLGYKNALKKSFLSLEGVSLLLNNMNESMITTNATVGEHIVSSSHTEIQEIRQLKTSYDFVQGWAIPTSKLQVMNDTMKVSSPNIFEVGGSNTLSEDRAIAHKSFGEVLLYVKVWEPPILDIIDYIEELIEIVDKVIIYPIGTEDEMYHVKEKFIKIWIDKFSMIDNNKKIWIKTS